jgi:hypothetical protein
LSIEEAGSEKMFICYIGNKDTSADYPKSLHVNKQYVFEALLWLEKHNPHYADITINESNLDWMNGKNEANIGTQASIVKTNTRNATRLMQLRKKWFQMFISHLKTMI